MTHKEVFSKKNVKSNEKCFSTIMCTNNECLKLELIFDEELNFLCDLNTPYILLDNNNKSTKRIILYYRFEYNNIQYVFVKLEGCPMNSLSHLNNYLNITKI
jgi:hypothetical protein